MAQKIYTVKNEAGETAEVDEARIKDAEKDGYFPVVSNGQQEARVSIADLPKAEADGFKPSTRFEGSQLESGVRGAAQGLTFGFADELTGALGSLGSLGTNESMLDAYRRVRDESRAAYEASQQANPGTYLAGEIAGGIAPALATGGGTALASGGLKAATIAGLKSGAKYGAVTGLGTGEADLTKGELGKAAAETAIGAGTGAIVGGALPTGIEAIKGTGKLIKKGAEAIVDRSGQLGTTTIESAKMAAKGESILSGKALRENTDEIAKSAEKLATTLGGDVKEGAKKKVSESLSSEQKIDVTDDIDNYLTKIKESMGGLDERDPDAIKLGSIKAKLERIKDRMLTEAGEDPAMDTQSQAYAKLLKKKAELEAQQRMANPEEKAIDNLFNSLAKMKGKWKPDQINIERIQRDFNLPDTDSAAQMLKEVASLKINKPKMVPKLKPDGTPLTNPNGEPMMELVDVPFELRQVIKKYSPEIVTEGKYMGIRQGPGKVTDLIPFRPDVAKQEVKLTPQELLNLRDDIRNTTFGQQGLSGKLGGDITSGLKTKLESSLESIDKSKLGQFKEGMQTYTDIYGLEDILGTSFTNLVNKNTGTLTPEGIAATKKISSFISNQMHGLDPAQQEIALKGIKERILRSAPELGEDFIDNLAHKSKLQAIQDIAQKTGSVKIAGTIESLGAKAGALAGTIVRPIYAAQQGAGGAINKLSKLGADELKTLSGQYRAKGSNTVANFLDNLSTITSSQKKNALLYTASQNPNIKAELFGEEEK